MVIESVTTRPWRWSKRVLPQHTDHGGVMWHGAYVAWLEEARVEALAAVGLPYGVVSEAGLEMPVVRLEIDYRQALHHGEQVLLESWALPRKGVRWPWRSRWLRSDGEVAAEARVELVLVRFEGGRRTLLRQAPEPLGEALRRLQQGPEPPA
ncbi:MAG: acyl-CoA thioesterase [Synechococcaceae bacterium WB9_4xC_028]|jgi:acyl-CoA thioester hydrolase|nr:acyl-CoA thioesterase [Synechococcaceae bacterium WB9_4xB_025]NDD69487.1 acyl-CoA thioesterase [Synechococcaceae bacterium WB9_4xC_028]